MQSKEGNTYYRDVGRAELLDAEEERRLALTIEAAEMEAWERLLSYAPVTSYALDLIELTLEGAPGLEKLRRFGEAARKRRTKASSSALVREAQEAAAQVRELDRDRSCLEAVLGELERIGDGAPADERALPGPLPFSRRSASFARALTGARAALSEAEAARNRFVESNLRLVFHVARPYLSSGVPLTDLVQEGSLGLLRAVDRFDPRRGTRFATYATWWIRHFIGRAIADKGRSVRIPVYLLDARQKISSTRRRLAGEFGRSPTDEELAEATGYSLGRIEAVREHGSGGEVSLDATFDDEEEGRQRAEIFRDPNSDERSPLDEVIERAAADELRELMTDLPPKEADILNRRFGLRGGEEQTLQEIADSYGVTRERIRQVQIRALERLRRRLEERRSQSAA